MVLQDGHGVSVPRVFAARPTGFIATQAFAHEGVPIEHVDLLQVVYGCVALYPIAVTDDDDVSCIVSAVRIDAVDRRGVVTRGAIANEDRDAMHGTVLRDLDVGGG